MKNDCSDTDPTRSGAFQLLPVGGRLHEESEVPPVVLPSCPVQESGACVSPDAFSGVVADALREARLYAESIVNTVREPLLVLDGDLRVHSVNQAFTTLFRLSDREIVGRFLHEFDGAIWGVGELAPRLIDVLKTGQPMEDFEATSTSAVLGPRTLTFNARKLHRGGERPELLLVAIDDVTERRLIQKLLGESDERCRQEEHIRRRQLHLANASRVSTVGQLAVGLAHELNQPLSSISNIVEACTRYIRSGVIDPPKLLALLGDVAKASMRAAGIVAHLRSFVDKGEPDLEAVDLGEIVSHIPNLLMRDIEAMDVELRLQLPDRKLPVLADRIQIEQVIVNLVQNAMDSIREAERPHSRIELGVRVVGGSAEVRVRDTGSGIGGEAAGRIFDPFYTTKKQGLGMGLALSRTILEAHRGRIWMEAPDGGAPGSEFCFTIPLRREKRRRKERPA